MTATEARASHVPAEQAANEVEAAADDGLSPRGALLFVLLMLLMPCTGAISGSLW